MVISKQRNQRLFSLWKPSSPIRLPQLLLTSQRLWLQVQDQTSQHFSMEGQGLSKSQRRLRNYRQLMPAQRRVWFLLGESLKGYPCSSTMWFYSREHSGSNKYTQWDLEKEKRKRENIELEQWLSITGCSYSGLRFNIQHPRGSSQPIRNSSYRQTQ